MNSNDAVFDCIIRKRKTTMDTKALRQKILDLAIHGKLVPQNPNDEPASVLLERIKAEKERLIKEGKIKRSRKSAKSSDTPHYPYLLPEGWEWCRLNEIAESSLGKTLDKSRNTGKVYPYLCAINVKWNDFDLSVVKTIRLEDNEKERYQVLKGDLLICEGGDVGRSAIWDSDEPIYYQNALHRVRFFGNIVANFYLYLIWCYKNHNWIDDICNGVTIKHFTQDKINALYFPLPPVAEQQRIVAEIKRWFSLIDIIETGKDDLQTTIKQAKSKILDLAIHGKLVPQDPNDEPAIELLKRINPYFTPCDNGHYTQLPNGWCECQLENIVKYEQPQAYIVKSTDYDDRYLTPVLTAGKSFIIGYTNETEGIYQNAPCIIFDDFTTDSKLVDFPFKVKSSAMKILKVADCIEIEYVAMFMNITRLIGDTHKRYWISEYSKLCIPIPPKEEQKRITTAVNVMFKKLNTIMENL